MVFPCWVISIQTTFGRKHTSVVIAKQEHNAFSMGNLQEFFFYRSTHIFTGVFDKKPAPVTLFYTEGFQFRVSYVGVEQGMVLSNCYTSLSKEIGSVYLSNN